METALKSGDPYGPTDMAYDFQANRYATPWTTDLTKALELVNLFPHDFVGRLINLTQAAVELTESFETSIFEIRLITFDTVQLKVPYHIVPRLFITADIHSPASDDECYPFDSEYLVISLWSD